MKTIHTFLMLSTAVFLTACANPNAPGAGPMSAAKVDEHAAHQAASAPSGAPSAMHDHMKKMQVMRDKMMNAKTPAERQALMDEHMKTMHEGMTMMKGMKDMKDMKEMGGMHGKPGMPGMAGMKDMPMDMAKHHQMMEMRMDLMQTMMEMMMQRMPGVTIPPAGK
ncbi:MAG: hypothetical protein U1E12_09725 [Hydrogenophaga sp.]|uniref:hypothetical protein n=1 Tax=Hydrogenophaga sp. TaxID=1904254 RepID=UPI00271AFD6A|nr:hypothetical protein [Hydrogenophaga sp.]MDO9201993.1 hypothetical protein [Hydrogenophaga sp.]MDP3628920.1 hypothetical protein [Hydrogenophaga sp.]MDZ4101938.1 hypothetical protein [Hydrogenophaga sp.]MDZ4280686.1 hypothetical protein [Hydrogenophaga sp.]